MKPVGRHQTFCWSSNGWHHDLTRWQNTLTNTCSVEALKSGSLPELRRIKPLIANTCIKKGGWQMKMASWGEMKQWMLILWGNDNNVMASHYTDDGQWRRGLISHACALLMAKSTCSMTHTPRSFLSMLSTVTVTHSSHESSLCLPFFRFRLNLDSHPSFNFSSSW